MPTDDGAGLKTALKTGQKGSTSLSFEREREAMSRSFAPMIKSVGPLCNLDCHYCYYVEKDALYPDKSLNLNSFLMPDTVLEQIIRDYIASQSSTGARIEFIWHGGEPTIAGVDYFRRVVELQKRYAAGREVYNALQTNGTLIDDRWAEFLAENNFLCGLSIDGPRKFHDKHRRRTDGSGTWERVVGTAQLLAKHGVEFNTMTVVNASNSKEPIAVYNFLKDLGSRHMQFSPIVERIAQDENEAMSVVDIDYGKATALMSENVSAADWGNFLCRIFDKWVRHDVGHSYVNWFDNTLAAYVGQTPSLCSMAAYCGCSPAIEHNGDVFCCDHFVFPQHKLGNILTDRLSDMVKSDKQLFFEQRKRDTLSAVCRCCPYLSMCGGDCPKNRIATTPQGESISDLCAGFRKFFAHTQKHFEFMASELAAKRPPSNVMRARF